MWPFEKSPVERIKEGLKPFPALAKVEVEVHQNRAVFSGEVPERFQVGLLESVASGVSGITGSDTAGVRVLNPPQPRAPEKPPEDPLALQRQVVERIRKHAELSDNPLDVVQSGQTVRITGAVDSEQERQLVAQAASVPGATVDLAGVRVEAKAKEKAKEVPTYTVAKGDTLGAIAAKFYGNVRHYPHLAKVNNIPNPDKISVGQVLRIEPLPAAPPPAAGEQVYTVARGDTLGTISAKFYGNPRHYMVIAKANNLPNPDRIDVGQVLKIPPVEGSKPVA